MITVLQLKRTVCLIFVVLIFATVAAGCAPAAPEQTKTSIPQPDKDMTPNTPNGLDVYVWQMAKHSYSFGVLPHSETPRSWLSEELMSLRGTSAAEMRQILAGYDVDRDQIHIIPWQNPLSSYIGDYWIIRDGEDTAQVRAEYVKFIESMLFGEYTYPVFADCVFDVDNDGGEEYCVLSAGPTSGVFSFKFSAFDGASEQPKYQQVFCTQFYTLSFRYDYTTGRMYIKAVTQGEDPQTHYYDVVIENGVAKLELTDYKE